MAKQSDDHPGSGLDKPKTKTVFEKAGEGMKSVLQKQERDKLGSQQARPESKTKY